VKNTYMKKKPTWIIVANKTRAKIFESAGIKESPREIMGIDNPAGYLREQDLVSDRPGRSMHSPFSRRSARLPRNKKTEHIIDTFINQILTELEVLKRKGRFGSLILIAEPRLLGKFRGCLEDHEQLQVEQEVPRDLLKTPDGSLGSEIQKYIKQEKHTALL